MYEWPESAVVFDAMNVRTAEPARQQGEDEVFAELKLRSQQKSAGVPTGPSTISLAFAPGGGVKVYDLPPQRARAVSLGPKASDNDRTQKSLKT